MRTRGGERVRASRRPARRALWAPQGSVVEGCDKQAPGLVVRNEFQRDLSVADEGRELRVSPQDALDELAAPTQLLSRDLVRNKGRVCPSARNDHLKVVAADPQRNASHDYRVSVLQELKGEIPSRSLWSLDLQRGAVPHGASVAGCEIRAKVACRAHSRCVGAAATEQHESFSVPRVGVDTVSFAWRPTGDELLWRRLRGGAEDGHICGIWQVRPAGVVGGWMLKKKLGSASWFFYPDNELIYCEGRLGAMLSDDLRDFSLGPFFSLGMAALNLEEVFAPVVGRDRETGISDERGRVRRLDLAAELRWSDPADGIAALDALADLTLPRVKVCEWRHEGRTETIAYYTATKKKRLLHRIYDKGVQGGSDPAGTLLRFERQHRFNKASQTLAEEVAWQGDPEALWLDGFEDWAKAAEDLNVAGPDAAQRHLIEKVERGELQREKAERLIGSLAVARLRGEGWWRDLGKPHLGRRRRRELADHGLALAPSAKSQPDVPLGEAIRALRVAWREPTNGQAAPGSAARRTKREQGAKTAMAQTGREAN